MMNPIRRKMVSFLTETVQEQIKALDPGSELAKELDKIDNVDETVAEEIEKICRVATLADITKVFLMVKKLKKASEEEQETIKSALNDIAQELAERVQAESGPLKLSPAYRHLFSEL